MSPENVANLANLVEFVARALYLTKRGRCRVDPWDTLPEGLKGHFLAIAAQVIEAMELAGMVPVVIDVEPAGMAAGARGKEFIQTGWAAMLATDFLTGKAKGLTPAAKLEARAALFAKVIAKQWSTPAAPERVAMLEEVAGGRDRH